MLSVRNSPSKIAICEEKFSNIGMKLSTLSREGNDATFEEAPAEEMANHLLELGAKG